MARRKAATKQAGSSARREYSAAARAAAVADVAALGLSKAAAMHGVPLSTRFDWRKAASTARPPAAALGIGRRGSITAAVAAPRRPAKSYTPSQRAQILETAAKDGVSAAAAKHGCSRFTIYDWRAKVERAAAGEGVAPTSGPAPADVEAQRDQEILDEWHRHPGLGPSQIRNQLRAKCVKVAVHTVQRVMPDAGSRPPKVERRPHDRRFEAVRPNALWMQSGVFGSWFARADIESGRIPVGDRRKSQRQVNCVAMPKQRVTKAPGRSTPA